MAEILDRPNFYSMLDTKMSRKQIADLYGALGWKVGKATWVDYEVASDWAQVTIEAESPILMNGHVADLPARAEELLAPLRAADVKFIAECYGPEPGRELLLELRS